MWCSRFVFLVHQFGDISPHVLIDHLEEELANCVSSAIWQTVYGAFKALGLQGGQPDRQIVTLCRGVKEPLTPVDRSGPLLYEILIDKLLQDTPKTLLGNAQNAEQIRHHDAGVAIHEVKHAVVSPPKTEFGQLVIRIGGKIAISEKKQLDQVIWKGFLHTWGALIHRGAIWTDHVICKLFEIYVSHIDLFRADCYLTSVLNEIFDRFGDVLSMVSKRIRPPRFPSDNDTDSFGGVQNTGERVGASSIPVAPADDRKRT